MKLTGKQKLLLIGVVGVSASITYFLYRVYKTNKRIKETKVSREELDEYVNRSNVHDNFDHPTLFDDSGDQLGSDNIGLRDRPVHSVLTDNPGVLSLQGYLQEQEELNAASQRMLEERLEKTIISPKDTLTPDIVTEEDEEELNERLIEDDWWQDLPGRRQPIDWTSKPHDPDYSYNVIEGKIMRYDPNSADAENQYEEMMLAGFDKSGDPYTLLTVLFGYDFKASNAQDDTIMNRVRSRRRDFFGPDNLYSEKVTMADVILDFAYLMDQDFDGGMERWADDIVQNLDIDLDTYDNLYIETVIEKIENLDYMTYDRHGFNPPLERDIPRIGMFGLTEIEMTKGEDETIMQQFWDYQSMIGDNIE